MDEPTSALDNKIIEVLFNLCKEKNITYITAGHDEALLQVFISFQQFV